MVPQGWDHLILEEEDGKGKLRLGTWRNFQSFINGVLFQYVVSLPVPAVPLTTRPLALLGVNSNMLALILRSFIGKSQE